MIRHHGGSKPSRHPPDEADAADEAVQTQQATDKPTPPQINRPVHPPDKNPTVQKPVLKIPIDRHASVARQNQAHFLERLSAIKAARGEQDEVTVYAKKRYTGTGWRSRQRIEKDLDTNDEAEGGDIRAIREGDDNEDQDGDGEGEDENSGAATGFRRTQTATRSSRAARQRKPRSRGPRRSERAGLFRDYRPRAGNSNGGSLLGNSEPGDGNPAPTVSDSRAAISVPTPRTWNQLVAPGRESGGDSPRVADAEPAIGPTSAAIPEGAGNQDETEDVLMEDV